jgi:hypothetical protein
MSDEQCRWCDREPATCIVYGWPTGARCAKSRQNRVDGYQGRLARSAKEQ